MTGPRPPYYDNISDKDGKASRIWLSYFQSLGGSSGGGAVNSVSGISGEITITGTPTDPIVGISSAYHGSSNLTHLGTVTLGVWNGSPIGSAYLPSGFAGLANPTAQIGLTAVNGTSTSAIRSDGAPALSQAIVPTWTGLHTFAVAPKVTAFAGGGSLMVTTDTTGQLGTASIPGGSTGANPSASIGLSVINGSASTFMRSDAAPPISQAITPTWSGTHTFTLAPIVSSLTASQAVFSDGSNHLVSNTITGTGSVVMSASPTLTGTITAAALNLSGQLASTVNGGGNTSGLRVVSAAAALSLAQIGAGTDGGEWDVVAVAGRMIFRAINDASSSSTVFMDVHRSGMTISDITFASPIINSSLTASLPVFSDGTKTLVSNAITGTGNVMMSDSPTTTGTLTGATATFSGQIKSIQSGFGSAAGIFVSSNPYAAYGWKETGASADNGVWHIIANGEQLRFSTLNDANNAGTDFMVVDRTGITVDSITVASPIINSALTASSAVFSDGSKTLVSNAITGTGNVVMSASPTLTGIITANGDLKIATVGNGVYIKEGSDATMGAATLVLGTATVNTVKVTASSRIFLGVESLGTITSPVAVAVTARTAGTSFTITSANLTDTSVISWVIIEPA